MSIDYSKYETVIGLEIHVQLNTQSKAYCSDSTKYGAAPNTHISPISLGHPGPLPVSNEKVIEYAVRLGLALNCDIRERNEYARKNYFYADLPKGYQITQDKTPICNGGFITITDKNGLPKKSELSRIHMEEEAGKLVLGGSDRLAGSKYSLVDYNRAGIALCEIVSKPDIRTGREASEYASEIRRTVRYLGVSDGNMQEGSLRCDVNISVRKGPDAPFGTKVEIKNMNSFSAIQKACDYEIARQIEVYENGGEIYQETRLWDEGKQLTKSMRLKEGSSDYRYFPDPDLGPIEISKEQKEKWFNELPELPSKKRKKYVEELGLSPYDSRVISDEIHMANFFEKTVANGAEPKLASNWITSDIVGYLKANKLSFSELKLSPENLAEMINMISKNIISGKIAKEILPELIQKNISPKNLVEEKGLAMISDSASILPIIDELISDHPNEVEAFRNGKTKLLGFFVGQLMKRTKGKADPKLANKLVSEKLNS